MRNKRFVILIFGVVCVLIYAVLLYFHPQESWCDDAFWTDWGRQLALHGRYFTTVWGGGHPSYCPLYAYVLAGWISVFGFSFFKVRMLNVLLLAACYYAFTLYLVNRSLLKNLVTILLFSSLFWFLPSLFEIYNCGRIEVLCLLLGISSFIFFSKIQESASRFNIFGLFVSSFLLFATGVEGVIFAVLMCVSFSIFLRIKKIQKRTVLSYSIIGFGYISSLVSLVIITKKNNCLHQFFDTMFGFSNTLSKYYFSIRAFVKNAIHGQLASLQLSLSSDSVNNSLLSTIGHSYCMNKEQLFLLLALLFVLALFVLKKKNIPYEAFSFSFVAFLSPLIFTFAGRYVSYYVWVTLIPALIAICLLLDHLESNDFIIKSVLIIGILIYSAFVYDWDSFDMKRERDNLHQKEISNVSDLLFPNKPCVIPYQWYYYVVPKSENIYFQGSGGVPKDIQYIIYCPNDYNEEGFMKCFELEKVRVVEDKIIYRVDEIVDENIIRY